MSPVELEPASDTKLTDRRLALPDPHQAACLVYIYPTGPRLGSRYFLGPGTVRIGRSEGSDIRLDDSSISRRHARIDLEAGAHVVQDLGSTNGTRVNDEPVVGFRILRDGDYLRVGDIIYRYLEGGNLEAGYHEEIYRLAIQDALTRLPNRRALDEFLEREVTRAQRHARPLSVLLLDLDRFKAVNDTHGHLCGDTVLRAVADLLRPLVRADDLCARYGGEEFAVALVETGHAAALAVAERIRVNVATHPFRFEATPLALTTSIGVATINGGAETDPSDLLRAADQRLYAAKRSGRDRVVGADET